MSKRAMCYEIDSSRLALEMWRRANKKVIICSRNNNKKVIISSSKTNKKVMGFLASLRWLFSR